MKSVLLILLSVGGVIILIAGMLVFGMTRMDHSQNAAADPATEPSPVTAASSSPVTPPVATAVPPKPAPAAAVADASAQPAQVHAADVQKAAEPDGTVLSAEAARIHGFQMHLRKGNPSQIVYWVDAQEYLEWKDAVHRAGTYSVEITYACAHNAGGTYVIVAGPSQIRANTEYTGGWKTLKPFVVGKIIVPQGRTTVILRCDGNLSNAMMNVSQIRLIPEAK